MTLLSMSIVLFRKLKQTNKTLISDMILLVECIVVVSLLFIPLHAFASVLEQDLYFAFALSASIVVEVIKGRLLLLISFLWIDILDAAYLGWKN